jgi:hypothetical protein
VRTGDDETSPTRLKTYFDTYWADPIEKTAEKAKARNWTTQPKALDELSCFTNMNKEIQV